MSEIHTIDSGQHGCGDAIAMSPMPCGSHSRPVSQPADQEVRWYCVCTHPQREFEVYGRLKEQGFQAYLPLYLDRSKEHDRILPMFRGYLFVGFDVAGEPWRKICHTRGVWFLLSSSPERPMPIPRGVVEDLISRTSGRQVVDDPGPNRSRVSYIQLGTRAKVLDGPLAGWQGICTMSGPRRIRLLMKLLGGTREIEFGTKMVSELGKDI
jgi:transcriptional antiterminator RfaH